MAYEIEQRFEHIGTEILEASRNALYINMRYLDVARSLLQGRGLRVRNMPSDYQKILYPLCILPALLLKTTAAQITAIGWLNAVYMASAVFPAYALARAMGMNRRRTAFLVGVTAVLPTMSQWMGTVLLSISPTVTVTL